MRLAVVSDIHGNLTALEAVIADLKEVSPDLVVQAGDLVASGFRPAEVVDRVRQLGWPGVQGNTDEMPWRPGRLSDLALKAPKLQPLLDVLKRIAATTRDLIGSERIDWLRMLPTIWCSIDRMVSIVHASPKDLWKAPLNDVPDEELERVYGSLGSQFAVYGHIHRPFIRRLAALTVANCGSLGLSYDGDRRASYLVAEKGKATIRRIEYDVEQEVRGLKQAGYPYANWLATILHTGRYQPPPPMNASARKRMSGR